jgi:hypothetical protein
MICRIYHNTSTSRNEFPYLIELQHEHMSALPIVLVAPISTLGPIAPPTIPKLCPQVSIGGIKHIVQIPMMASIRRSILGTEVNPNICEIDTFEIQASVNLLITGF